MKHFSKKILMLLTVSVLSGCSSFSDFSSSGSKVDPTIPRASGSTSVQNIANNPMQTALDKYDQEKMSHALDKPLGKSSDWTNPKTGTNYIVTPTAKLTYNGNPYCRKYSIVSSKNGAQHQSGGTACVSATDSSWQIVN